MLLSTMMAVMMMPMMMIVMSSGVMIVVQSIFDGSSQYGTSCNAGNGTTNTVISTTGDFLNNYDLM